MNDAVPHVPPLSEDAIDNATFDIVTEVRHQDVLARSGKFGGTHVMPGGTDLERLAVLAEEFGEASIEVCKGIVKDGYERRENLLYGELVQVAAVSLAWAAAILEGREG